MKYPRTPHLPWSAGATNDDKVLKDVEHFRDKPLFVTEKMDGENTTLYRDGIHTRSLDSRHHESRAWIKQFHASFAHLIPEGWRICGENMYAFHSIFYDDLPSYFMPFSVWNGDWCLPVGDEYDFYQMLRDNGVDIHPVPNLSIGLGIDVIESGFLGTSPPLQTGREGYVVRTCEGFKFDEFDKHVAKCVRANHVQTNQHWMHAMTMKNVLAKDKKYEWIEGSEPESDEEP